MPSNELSGFIPETAALPQQWKDLPLTQNTSSQAKIDTAIWALSGMHKSVLFTHKIKYFFKQHSSPDERSALDTFITALEISLCFSIYMEIEPLLLSSTLKYLSDK